MNNEVVGISAELAIADVFGVYVKPEYRQRGDEKIKDSLMECIVDAFESEELPIPIRHVADINIKISAEETKLERTLKKSDVEGYIIDALNSDAKTLVSLLVDRVTLYEDTIEISYKYSNNTNPDETLTEVHRDFLLCGLKIKVTQRCFTAIFELNR